MKSVKELMSIKIIPEILDEVAACKTEDEIKTVLRKNNSPAIRLMFQYVWDPRSVFSITELPPYKPDPGPIGISPSSLFYEMKRFYVLLESKNLPLKKKREILGQILESIHPSEAELVGKILKHDLGIPLLTPELVRDTLFPQKPQV
jgi:hypothetical protein